MNSKAFTANFFLTTSQEVANKFSLARKVSNFIDQLTPEEKGLSFIHYPGKQNSNLLEFSYEFGGKEKDQSFLSLKFLESNLPFEKYYLQDSIDNQIYRANTNTPGVYSNKPIYVSFGVGDNLEEWAGVFNCSLKDANFILTESAVKIITLNFVPAQGLLLRNSYMRKIGYEAKINTSDPVNTKIVISQSEIIKIADLKKHDKLNTALQNLLNKYLVSISGMQAISILPDVEPNYHVIDAELFNQGRGVDAALKELGVKAYIVLSKKTKEKIKENISKKSIESFLEYQRREIKNLITHPFSLHQIIPSNIETPEEVELKLVCEANPIATVPDPFKPINELSTKLKKLFSSKGSKTVGYQGRVVIENNYKLLELWKKYKFIDKLEPTIVYGDSRLLNKFLYPDRNFQTETNVIPTNFDFEKYKNSKYEDEYNSLIAINQDDFRRDKNKLNSTPNAIPIFNFSNKNGNIISLNFKNEAGYQGLLRGAGFKPDTITTYVNRPDLIKLLKEYEKLKDLDNNKNVNDLQQPIPNQQPTREEQVRQEIIAKVKTIYSSSPQYDPKVNLDAILKNMTKEEVGIAIRYFSTLSAEISAKEINEIMMKSVVFMTIRTLPYFKISSLGVLGLLCFLIGDNNRVFNVRPFDDDSFLTGYYNILSFRHVITKSDCYSEFSLQRQFGYTYPEIKPDTGEVIFPATINNELKQGTGG